MRPPRIAASRTGLFNGSLAPTASAHIGHSVGALADLARILCNPNDGLVERRRSSLANSPSFHFPFHAPWVDIAVIPSGLFV